MGNYNKLLFSRIFLFLGLSHNVAFSTFKASEIISGDVTISETEVGNFVVEASDRSIIHYESFSIQKGEKVTFIQPSSSSTLLNKVIGSDPSHILGQMESNGRVFLVNPQGVYFGDSAQIDMGSLIVSTMDIAEDEFLENQCLFTQGEVSGEIVNLGAIKVEKDAIFLSSNIKNEGLIVAKTGKVVLASGEKIALDFTGNGLMSFAIEGSLSAISISQEGTIQASQGEVLISMGKMHRVIEEMINVEGIDFGDAFLETEQGIFLVDGSKIEACQVAISGNEGSFIDVSGDIHSFHEVSIQGEEVRVNPSSKIKIGIESGGSVSIFSEEETSFAGDVSVRGGTIEIGGRNQVLLNPGIIEAPDWKLSGHLHLSSDIATHGGNLVFDGPLEIEGSILIDSRGGHICFKDSVDGGGLAVDAGSGQIQFFKEIGKNSPLDFFHITEGSKISLSGNIVTKGGEVSLKAPLLLLSDVKIDTTASGSIAKGSDISFLEGVLGNYRLELDAGNEGSLQIEKGIGSVESAISSVFISAFNIRLKGDIKADGGTIVFDGPVVLTDDISITDKGPTGIVFLSTLNANGSPHSLSLSAPIGKVSFLGEIGGISPLENLLVNSSEIRLGDNIDVAGNLSFQGPVTLIDNVLIEASEISFKETLDGPYNLSCNVSGSIVFENKVGSIARLGEMRIIQANNLSTKAVFANSLIQESGSGVSLFEGVLNTVGVEGVTLHGNSFFVLAGVHTENSGHFSLTHTGSATLQAAFDLSGPFYDLGSGTLNLSGNIVTNENSIEITSPTQLLGDLSLSTKLAGPGSITFLNKVDGSYSLSLAAGLGDVVFLEDLGSTIPLGDVFIQGARNVTVSQSIHSESMTQLEGLGMGTYTGSITTTGVMGIYLFSEYLDFGGRDSGQVLKTVGEGNVVLNSWYKRLGTKPNPIELSILGGSGTVFEGSCCNVYFSSQHNEVDKICTVRANPGSKVLYKEGSSPYVDRTPGICCTNVPPPPPPPHPHHHKNNQDKYLFYIPGIYTNYWQFKDTLGAPWYFHEPFRYVDALFNQNLTCMTTCCESAVCADQQTICSLIFAEEEEVDICPLPMPKEEVSAIEHHDSKESLFASLFMGGVALLFGLTAFLFFRKAKK